MAALTRGKDELVTAMRAGKYVDLAADYGWEIIAGTARFAGSPDSPELRVSRRDGGTATIEAGHYLIATGAAPWIPPADGLKRAGYLTSATAMELTELPGSMLVIGGNAVGLEMAQLFARLGTRVTIAEALDRLAPFEEPEVSAAIEDALDDEGIGIRTAATVMSVRREATSRSVRIRTAGDADQELAYGQVLVAAGRRPHHLRRPCSCRKPHPCWLEPMHGGADVVCDSSRRGRSCDGGTLWHGDGPCCCDWPTSVWRTCSRCCGCCR